MRRTVFLLAAARARARRRHRSDWPMGRKNPKPPDADDGCELLAINDFHGHLEPKTPGAVGCDSGAPGHWAVPAAGGSTSHTHEEARPRVANTIGRRRRPDRREPPRVRGSSTTSPRSWRSTSIGSTCSGSATTSSTRAWTSSSGCRTAGCLVADPEAATTVDTCPASSPSTLALPLSRGERVPHRGRTSRSSPRTRS